jgi:hypothetical protein
MSYEVASALTDSFLAGAFFAITLIEWREGRRWWAGIGWVAIFLAFAIGRVA